jgi:hypothetical protein
MLQQSAMLAEIICTFALMLLKVAMRKGLSGCGVSNYRGLYRSFILNAAQTLIWYENQL